MPNRRLLFLDPLCLKKKKETTFAANESEEMSESFAAEAATKTEICLRMNSVQKQDKIFQLTH